MSRRKYSANAAVPIDVYKQGLDTLGADLWAHVGPRLARDRRDVVATSMARVSSCLALWLKNGLHNGALLP